MAPLPCAAVSIHLDDAVTAVPGVGRALAARLADAFDIRRVRELLEHYPRRYQDAGDIVELSQVRVGEPATLIGEVLDWDTRTVPPKGQRRQSLRVSTARIEQTGGGVFLATFFNQPWRAGQLHPGSLVACSGEVSRFKRQLQLTTPDVQLLAPAAAVADVDEATARLDHRRLLAVYRATEELPSFKLAAIVEAAQDQLADVDDWLPDRLRARHGLLPLGTALHDIHRPVDRAAADAARRRLVFDELVTLQLGLQWRRAHLEAGTVGRDNTPVDGGWAQRLIDALPFPPTAAQRRAFEGIGVDLGAPRPMHRLLQGDVGSGKTVVAACALLDAVECGSQGAVMAPTEILAVQHARTFQQYLEPIGVRVGLLTGDLGAAEKRALHESIADGQVDIVVGTHAIIQQEVAFNDLGLVVIDEQHKFGVEQRGVLYGKGVRPDVLVMTATPIPRSLALTLYGDLDVTVLDELPPGRQPIRTQLITPAERHRRERLYDFVRTEVAAGRRAYVVCPFVEPSEAVAGTAVVREHQRLSEEVFADVEVELLHGRMRPDAKERAMARFRTGQAPILVATTVIEVGVDVSEASLMIIEDAERFGISQLHQLRGRVDAARMRATACCSPGSATRRATSTSVPGSGWRRSRRPPTGSRSPSRTSRSAAPGSCSARNSRGCPTSSSPTSPATGR